MSDTESETVGEKAAAAGNDILERNFISSTEDTEAFEEEDRQEGETGEGGGNGESGGSDAANTEDGGSQPAASAGGGKIGTLPSAPGNSAFPPESPSDDVARPQNPAVEEPSPAPPSDPPVESLEYVRTSNYRWQHSLVHASAAYSSINMDAGAHSNFGEGVTIGFLDTGIDVDHPAFAGKSVREVFLEDIEDEDGTISSHGTKVASVAAGVAVEDRVHDSVRRIDSRNSVQGVAPAADIVVFAVDLLSPILNADSYSDTLNWFSRWDGLWEQRFKKALEEDIDILNLSIGLDRSINEFDRRQLQDAFGRTLAAMNQKEDDSGPTLLVWAAGNSHAKCASSAYTWANCPDEWRLDGEHVNVLSGFMVPFKRFQGYSVAVVGVDRNGVIASDSNRCGSAAKWCIAAPGKWLTMADYGPKKGVDGYRYYTVLSGTSYAAAMVSGGLALIMQRFRDQMNPQEVLSRMFETANKQGRYEASEVYGQGLMDLGAATSEVGATSVALGQMVDGPSARLRSTRLSFGPSFGAGAVRAFSGHEIAAFDELAAPFWRDMGSLVTVKGTALAQRLSGLLAQPAEAWDSSPAMLPISSAQPAGSLHLGLMRDDPGFQGVAGPSLEMRWSSQDESIMATAFTTEGGWQLPARGIAVAWRPLGLRVGLIDERQSTLGTLAQGGFGRVSSQTLFAGIEGRGTIGPWSFKADIEVGSAVPSVGSGMLQDVEPMAATRFGLHASNGIRNSGQIQLSLEQPLRVEEALATLDAPIGRTQAGEVVRKRWRENLAPAGRQVDLSAWWRLPKSENGSLRMGAVYSRHPQHDAKSPPALSVLVGYRIDF